MDEKLEILLNRTAIAAIKRLAQTRLYCAYARFVYRRKGSLPTGAKLYGFVYPRQMRKGRA